MSNVDFSYFFLESFVFCFMSQILLQPNFVQSFKFPIKFCYRLDTLVSRIAIGPTLINFQKFSYDYALIRAAMLINFDNFQLFLHDSLKMSKDFFLLLLMKILSQLVICLYQITKMNLMDLETIKPQKGEYWKIKNSHGYAY